MKTEYVAFGLSLTDGQKQTLAKAGRAGTGATIRLTHGQLRGDDKLALTKVQAARIVKKISEGVGMELSFTKTQLKKMTKMGGFLPLLALLPLLFGGLSAAGAVAGGTAGVVKAVQSKQAGDAALAEAARHNRELEAQVRGTGLYLGRETRGGCCPMCNGSGLYIGQKN